MKKNLFITVLLAFVVALLPTFAWGAVQTQNGSPGDAAPADENNTDAAAPAAGQNTDAPAEAEGRALTGTIVFASEKFTQVSPAGDDNWQPAEVGMQVSAGARFRTGPKAIIQVQLPPDQIITIDRLSVVTLLSAVEINEKQVKTEIGLEKGRTVYEVSDEQVDHQASIRSRSGTHAVRGTESIGVTDDGLAFVAHSFNNTSTVTRGGKSTKIGGQGQKASLPGNQPTVAHSRFVSTINDPSTSRSRTDTEMMMIASFPSLGGRDFGAVGGEGFRTASTNQQINQQFSHQLGEGNFTNFPLFVLLTWNNTNSDLDLFTRDSAGYLLSPFTGVGPGAIQVSPNGGFAGPDSRLSGVNLEYVVYVDNRTIPLGNFEAGVNLYSGDGDNFNIRVFRNGRRIANYNGTVNNDQRTDSTDINIGGNDDDDDV